MRIGSAVTYNGRKGKIIDASGWIAESQPRAALGEVAVYFEKTRNGGRAHCLILRVSQLTEAK